MKTIFKTPQSTLVSVGLRFNLTGVLIHYLSLSGYTEKKKVRKCSTTDWTISLPDCGVEAEPARRPYHRHHRRNPRRTLPLPPAAAAVRTEPTIIDLLIQILSLEGSTGLKVIKPYSWVVVYLKIQKVSLYGRGLIL